ncbi:MAG: selenide, water dikinase SelD [Synechococcales cyanobacterium M58_A2018_015]|nr:selenide, water dikinase SelD [Synechococcales cyanobacterium M58_A2018_015]
MQALPRPITQDLVLIGGGHSHAIVLKRLGMQPVPGVRVTLISDVSHTPYSGMLPGYVAGFYEFDDCHIDLQRLCRFAGATLIRDQAIGLDLQQHRVQLANHPPRRFDWLSIDIGSTPAAMVPGASEYSIPVKPISQFLATWDRIVTEIAQQPDRSLRIAIVGGGAGGVELALSVQARLQSLYRAAGQKQSPLQLHLLHRGPRLIPERAAWVGRTLGQILTDRGVVLHLQESVTSIVAAGASARKLCCESGLTVECDYIFWVTQAAAAPWLAKSGLATDERGFVLVNDRLQSLSHPYIFAAGDVATMVDYPRPKAGVFAVRQGKALDQNLRRALQQQPLRSFVPQKEFLILIGTGDRRALASRGGLGIGPHALLWRWKDWIDRKFMRQFSDLQPMQPAPPASPGNLPHSSPEPAPTMPCAGCGSKVGSTILEQVLTRIQQQQPAPMRSDILIGLDGADDAAVVTVPDGQVLVQTVDHFRALLDDPFVFGQICANHCLSDLFAMAAEPQSALAIVTLPYAAAPQLSETLYQLLSGAVQVLHQAGAVLVGGHTTEGRELALGLTCNGLAAPDQLWRKAGMQPGQALILTKALGTGTLFAAEMQLQAKGRWIETAVTSMQQSNQAAATCLRQFQATACTDVTGFGLLGHLLEMVRASQVAVELDLLALPVLPGATETLRQGILSSLHPQNLQGAQQIANLDRVQTHPLFPLLFDPQTSGGLLAAVPAEQAEACVQALQALGYSYSRTIGRVLPLQGQAPVVVLSETGMPC